jgi:single-stranded-DNA-specific exonuclease
LLVKRWIKPETSPNVNEALTSALGISKTTADILINRGIRGKEEAEIFLRTSLDDLVEPFTLGDMEKVVGRILHSIREDEKVLVYGDYDADGITATALLVHFFRDIGKKVSYYIPKRQGDGYGITLPALRRIKESGVKLIITVDCGISSVEEVEAARAMGMDVIITDHHEPPETLPAAYAILDPCVKESGYPFTGLAGVGVAMKLVQGVMAGLDGKDKAGPGIDPRLEKYLDLVALGTIADVVPMRGENRILVRHGLALLKNAGRVGVRMLKEVSRINEGNFTAATVAFQMAPRLNASGRLGEAEAGVRLLLSDDPDEAAGIAASLDAMNQERRKIEEVILDEARAIILGSMDEGSSTIVLASDRWHQGVIGIVASKLVEEFYKPTVLISMCGGIGKGSARSIPGFHLYHGLEHCGMHLDAFGGHKYAAGLSIKEENLTAFIDEFECHAKGTLSADDFIPSVKIDSEVTLAELDFKLHCEINSIAPFGPGNPEPVLKAGGLEVLYPKIVGKDHVRMKMSQRGRMMAAIAFNMGCIYQSLAMGRVYVDAAFCLGVNEWQGERTLQLNIKDLHF